MCRSGQDSGRRVLEFGPSTVTATAVDRAKGLVPPGTSLRAGTAYPSLRGFGEVVIFLPFLMVRLVPLFLPFFVKVLEAFAIHMVHLVPHAVVTLALFAHACEMFVGMQPSVELFRYFFTLCQLSSVSPGPRAAPRPTRWADATFGFVHGGARSSSLSRSGTSG
jgi:hypothetical protein